MNPRFLSLLIAVLFLAGCNYDVALTEKPTRKIDARLLGDWIAVDKDSTKEESMHVRALDDSTYVVAFDNDIYRACHTDFAGTGFISVQDLNANNRLYLYLTAELSADSSQLTLRTVSNKVVPDNTKGRPALQKLIQANLANPKLYGDPLVFNRKK